MENQFAHFCVIESIEDPKQKLLLLIPTINDMTDFSKKAGYPVSDKTNENYTKTAQK